MSIERTLSSRSGIYPELCESSSSDISILTSSLDTDDYISDLSESSDSYSEKSELQSSRSDTYVNKRFSPRLQRLRRDSSGRELSESTELRVGYTRPRSEACADIFPTVLPRVEHEGSGGKGEYSEIVRKTRSKESDRRANYRHHPDSEEVRGFVVNVHDATNFDIDLKLNAELKTRYRDVIANSYTYLDIEQRDHEAANYNAPSCKGTTYRCRLRGIGLRDDICNQKSGMISIEVKRLIDRSDCWVRCVLSDIDIYRRLLVDIVIPTAGGDIVLADYLLKRSSGEMFYPYNKSSRAR